jgi:hypothetical protein
LDALTVGVVRTRVNWVLDADFRDYFSSLDHHWLGRSRSSGWSSMPEKTRLIRFGRFAAKQCQERRLGKPRSRW